MLRPYCQVIGAWHDRNSTFCPACGERIIGRIHFTVVTLDIIRGKCGHCGHKIPGIWWFT